MEEKNRRAKAPRALRLGHQQLVSVRCSWQPNRAKRVPVTNGPPGSGVLGGRGGWSRSSTISGLASWSVSGSSLKEEAISSSWVGWKAGCCLNSEGRPSKKLGATLPLPSIPGPAGRATRQDSLTSYNWWGSWPFPCKRWPITHDQEPMLIAPFSSHICTYPRPISTTSMTMSVGVPARVSTHSYSQVWQQGARDWRWAKEWASLILTHKPLVLGTPELLSYVYLPPKYVLCPTVTEISVPNHKLIEIR